MKMMFPEKYSFQYILLAVFLLLPIISSAGEEYTDDIVNLEPRPGIDLRIMSLSAKSPVATVILIPGGYGTLEIEDYMLKRGRKNLLVKTRTFYNDAGLNTVVLDTPSDERSMGGDFRTTNMHLTDIEHVVDWAINKYDLPVWVIGQSMGSISAAHAAIHLREKISGLVLNGSVSEPPKIGGTPVTKMNLSDISQPVLIIHHAQDGCYATPPSGAAQIKSMLTNSKNVKRDMLDGGSSSYGNPCYSGYHAFYELSDEVTERTVSFIKDNT